MAHDPSASVDVSADPDLDNRLAVSFPVVRRGYDQPQVDLVLRDMTAQIEALQATAAELREREADLHAALDAAEYRARAAEAAADELTAALEFATAPAPPDVPAPGRAASLGEDDTPTTVGPERGSAPEPAPTAGAGDVAMMVGEETARIIDAARHAAVEIGVRAREDAERVVAEARDEARSIRADAEVQLLHRTREADDAVAARLLEAADAVQEATARADAIVADAFTEAATVVLRAREEAEAIVAAAEAARDDLLVDLVRRRKVLHRQVEQLEAGRVRLRAAYAVVEGALTEATTELDRSVGEARDAAIAAAERADVADDPELRAAAAALGADADAVFDRADPDRAARAATSTEVPGAPVPPDPAGATEPAEPVGPTDPAVSDPAHAPGAGTPAGDGSVDGEAGAAEPVEAPSPEVSAPAVPPTAAAPEPASDGAATADGELPEIDLRTEPVPPPVPVEADVAVAAPGASGPAEPTARSTEPSSRRRRRAPDPVEFEGRWSSAVRVLPPGPETTDPDRGGERPPSASGPSASEVFARLRSGDTHQPSLFDSARPPEPAGPEPAGSDAAGDRAAPVGGHAVDPVRSPSAGAGDLADPEESWLARRDAALAPALRALRRRLKATLADDEDSLLESVRRTDPLPETIDSMRDALARRDDLAVALVASLATAAAAGAELAAGHGPQPDVERQDVAVDLIAVELADAVVGPLDERLDRCLGRYHKALAEVGADDLAARDAAMASLVSSIKAAYRARRGAQVQVPTEHAVLLAGHRGLVSALEPGTPLRWVVAAPASAGRRSGTADASDGGDDPAAGSRVCASCVAVADVGAGDPFGHGPLLPPARPGCRCAVAPVSAVVPRRP